MTPEDAARRLSLHLMDCGMLMPMEWLQKNGEGSELQEAFRMALDALNSIGEDNTRKTGKWETWAGGLPKCPVCGYEYCDKIECGNYCGNCGAKLDEES